MNVLGVSFDYHDAAAAIIVNGKIACAIQEERLSRIKHDLALPEKAIAACLDYVGLKPGELDAVVFYEDPAKKLSRIVRHGITSGPKGWGELARSIRIWADGRKYDVQGRLAEILGIQRDIIHVSDHHGSHAHSAFWPSPFEKSLVLTLDGVGEYETLTVWEASRTSGLRKLSSTHYPHSIGLWYSAFTAYLGFEVNEGEYKVMGMAAFGEPSVESKIESILAFKHGQIRLDQRYFAFQRPNPYPYSPRLVELLGPPRDPAVPFEPPGAATMGGSSESKRFADIAASVQIVTENRLLQLVKHWTHVTGVTDVAMAGGVALNSVANGRLQRELGIRLHVHAAAGDAGGAMGAALGYVATRGEPVGGSGQRFSPYLGLAYRRRDIISALRNYPSSCVEECSSVSDAIHQAAEQISEGKVIGWLQGRFEWGPRALGARSILASPTFQDMQDRVNRRIKFREPFRPFAPSVLAEQAGKYFDLPDTSYLGHPETYMLSVCQVRPEMRATVPAIVHVDGTARVQMVYRETSPVYHELISQVARRTGVPMVLNTSFNLKGEPIVSAPIDAIQTFEWSALDLLVIENFVIRRPDMDRMVELRLGRQGADAGSKL